MNCEKCHELLGDFLDGTLGGRERAQLRAHLDGCLSCAGVHEELESIVGAARESAGYLYEPPNERALWLRIRNTVEADASALRAAAAAQQARSRDSLWGRLAGKRWELSLPQVATAAAAVAVAVAFVTAVGLQQLGRIQPEQSASSGARRGAPAGRAVDGSYPQGYLQPHQASLRYWQQRVEQRKASWNPRMRDSFERSVTVLDQAVDDSLSDLRTNPHDEISEEMLNAALRDKIELLREFSEQ